MFNQICIYIHCFVAVTCRNKKKKNRFFNCLDKMIGKGGKMISKWKT